MAPYDPSLCQEPAQRWPRHDFSQVLIIITDEVIQKYRIYEHYTSDLALCQALLIPKVYFSLGASFERAARVQ